MNKKQTRGDIFSQSKTVALIGNYIPRLCGIATFTTDLRNALAREDSGQDFWALAMNDRAEGYEYPQPVRFEVSQNRFAEYRLAANFLNMNRVDLVSLQHEFGIYGGNDGAHIIALLRELRMPLVTTLHTVLGNPSLGQRQVMEELAGISNRFVVMSNLAIDILASNFGIDRERIAFIPHGIPEVPFIDPSYYKDQFGLEGRKVILTFGLLGPGKGLEHVIDALPRVVEKYPEIVYLILGATHPHVKSESGEAYRISLQQRARNLGVQQNVMFHNRFVSLEKLCEFLISADLYITPYLNKDQITSGTLAYAMGTGKAVISTPYLYAQEMLADGRGRLVPFADPDGISDQILDLFDNPVEMDNLRIRAYKFTRNMVWSRVARTYLDLFSELKQKRNPERPSPYPVDTTGNLSMDFPEINLDHLERLTDDTGILQHSRFMIPSRNHGYSTDDNARALIVAMSAQEVTLDPMLMYNMSNRYLSFLDFAFDNKTGKFRNFLTYNRRWSASNNYEDCHGRSIWSLGVTVALSRNESQSAMAMDLFERGLPGCGELQSPRAMALALLGSIAYESRFKGDRKNRKAGDSLTGKLLELYRTNATDDWPWIEDKVTYDNGRICQAMIGAGRTRENDAVIQMGLRSLEWLLNIQKDPAGHFIPIGNNGWYTKGGRKARYDQQPIEASAMIDACGEAYITTKDEKWAQAIVCCFDWFLGRNDLQLPVYDYTTGGCRDGLSPNGMNENQGAESTLSWLMSLVSLYKYRAVWGTVPVNSKSE